MFVLGSVDGVSMVFGFDPPHTVCVCRLADADFRRRRCRRGLVDTESLEPAKSSTHSCQVSDFVAMNHCQYRQIMVINEFYYRHILEVTLILYSNPINNINDIIVILLSHFSYHSGIVASRLLAMV